MSGPARPPRTLARLQGGLERLYRVETGLAVDDFVIDEACRDALAPARAAREQLLVTEQDGELAVALFVDAQVLTRLDDAVERGLPAALLGEFLLALEGVSHWVYTVVCARGDRPVSALELELQAEIDKYVTCVLASDADGAASTRWRRRLFDDMALEPALDAEERDRYRAANDNARRYAAALERRFVAPRRVPEMLAELRRLYRLPLAGKLALIDAAA